MAENGPHARSRRLGGAWSGKLRSRDDWKGSLLFESEEANTRTEWLLHEVGNILGRKWQPVIMFHLVDNGPMRFSELQKTIDSVSSKMLSEALDNLEESNLINRTVVSEKPLRVEYSLTPEGQSLQSVLLEMLDWGQKTITDGGNYESSA